ncbi:folate receptor gamma-like [Glandiceps talaboti]
MTLILVYLTTYVTQSNSWESIAIHKTYEENINSCLEGKHHKGVPEEEEGLHGQCTSWSNRACCEAKTTKDMHFADTWYSFDWNHCGNMSQRCWDFMMKDLCFYECSPNLGPWLVYVGNGHLLEEKKSFRDERYTNVPICTSECNAWWEVCKEDMTCSDNWHAGPWDWSTGKNTCKKECKRIEDYFGTPKKFCEDLWGGSYKIVHDEDKCMKLKFEGAVNPNDEVCKYYAVIIEEEKEADKKNKEDRQVTTYTHASSALTQPSHYLIFLSFVIFLR